MIYVGMVKNCITLLTVIPHREHTTQPWSKILYFNSSTEVPFKYGERKKGEEVKRKMWAKA